MDERDAIQRDYWESRAEAWDRRDGMVERFTEDLGHIGKNVRAAQDSYDKAITKLSEGPGNLVRQVEMLKELGAKTNKTLHSKLLERSMGEVSSTRE